MNKAIIYYSNNYLDGTKVGEAVKDQLSKIGLPIVSVTLKPIELGQNFVLEGESGYLTMFRQILLALEKSTADIIFFTEHDVLYPKEHFDFTPTDKNTFYYDHSWWKVGKGDLAVHWDADQVSGLCGFREALINYYKQRVDGFDAKTFDRKFEPMSGETSASWKASVPHIDVRGSHNLTYNKWSLDDFRKKETAVNFESSTIDKIPGWQDLSSIL